MIESPLQRRAPLPPQLTRRVSVLGIGVFLLFGVLAFRLWYLQVLTGTQNAAKATANVVRDVTIPAPRGNILDRNGALLATWRVAPQVAIVADDLPPRGPQRQLVYRRLARVLGIGWGQIRATVDDVAIAPPGYAPTDVMDDVSSYALYYIEGHKPLFPGVIVRQAYVRYYPQGDIGAVVLGQVGQITGPLSSSHPELGTAPYKGIAAGTIVGQSGLEATYQSYLQGTPGIDHVDVDAAGYPIAAKSTTVQPVTGDQVSTSLDLGLEKEGYIAADEARIKARLNGDPAPAASFVAIDPFSGRVLALGSVPTYNANDFATTPSTKTYDEILSSDALFDRAIDGGYPTGSTFKPITALAALGSGLITAQTLQGNGSCVTFGTTQKFCNSGSANYGNLDLVNALTVSEDTYFYRVGAAANGGSWPIQREARELGLGTSPGIDLPGGGTAGVVPDKAYVAALNAEYISQHCRSSSPGSQPKPAYAKQQLATTACTQGYLQLPWTIGQNVLLATGQGYLLASPLQMAIAYSAIVNGGKVWSPKIGTAILSPTGGLVAQLPAPTYTRVPINPVYQALVMTGLHGAAQSPSGTSYPTFGNFPLAVYGKTGTAVHAGEADQSWYVAYVPDPKRPIVIAFTVEQGGFGAAAAAPAVRLMLSEWFGLPEKWVVSATPSQDL
ncbi:MAG: penicillin-binding transpeptidase domain-containing protein [Solirubrobacteraceae bacterium]